MRIADAINLIRTEHKHDVLGYLRTLQNVHRMGGEEIVIGALVAIALDLLFDVCNGDDEEISALLDSWDRDVNNINDGGAPS